VDGFHPVSHVVVVGRSNIVGKPIANMLVQKEADADATVTICHSRTKDLPSITRQGDILIAAITHVPGGVGPMTITMLLYNTLQSARAAGG